MKIRLNTLLMVMTGFILLFVLCADSTQTIIRHSQYQISGLLIVSLISLVINERFQNEFLDITNFVMFFFYNFRIPFYYMDNPLSDVIIRKVDLATIPTSLNILIYLYLALICTLIFFNPRVERSKQKNFSESIFVRSFFLSAGIIILNFLYTISMWTYGQGPSSHILALILAVFSLDTGLILLIATALGGNIEYFRRYRIVFYGLISCAVLCFLYQGSKSGLLQVLLLTYFAILVTRGKLSFKLQSLGKILILTGLSFPLFFMGSAIRFWQRGQIRFDQIIEESFKAEHSISLHIQGFSYRIGFLDFYLDKMANAVYHPFISLKYYVFSLTDKLTPGFDLFEVPFMSRTLFNAFFGLSYGGTNSEQVTMFAESYLIFGLSSVLFFIAAIMLLKCLLKLLNQTSAFTRLIFSMYAMVIFYSWVSGFGLDMLLFEMLFKGIFFGFILIVIKFSLKWKYYKALFLSLKGASR